MTKRPEPPKPGGVLPPARPPTPSQRITKWDNDWMMGVVFLVGAIGIAIVLVLR